MKQHWDVKKLLVDTLYFMMGSMLYSLGLYTFASNAGFATGGISGLALILTHYTGVPIGTLTLLLNIPVILICAKAVGLAFILKSGWVMLINAFFIDIVFPLFPTYTGSPLLAAMFTGALIGAGIGIIYIRGSSTGGVDFIVMTFKKLLPHFSIGRIWLVVDLLIILLGAFVFRNIDAVLYGIISSFACTMMMDKLLYGAGSGKLAIIITDHGCRISKAIADEVDRGSTLIPVQGIYTGKPKDMLLCVCSKSQICRVRNAALSIDPASMVIITETNEVFGEGFTPLQIPGNEPPPPS